MIDVSDKEDVERTARACGEIRLSRVSLDAIREGRIKKGDAIECARIAGTMAVKKTHELVPYCHQVPLDFIGLEFCVGEQGVSCTCEVRAHYRTGVEMEALLGVEIALLTIWDMVKYLEKDADGQYPSTEMLGIKVLEKKKGIYDKFQ
jgi:cyclic pyranopterin phosphate synthase